MTDPGQVLLRRAQRILDKLADLQREIASMRGEIRGVLRVACLPTFGKKYLIPVVLGYPIETGDVRAVFRSDDFDALRLAALAGLGIANLPDWVVGPDIHSGSFVHVLPELVSRPERNTTLAG